MIVSKATGVYIIMVVVLVGGLWLILEVGSTLLPPTDLAGKWELVSATASPPGSGEPTGGATGELSVEQSGKFVNLVMGDWTANLKIEHDGDQNPTQPHGVFMTGKDSTNGKDQTVTFDALGTNDQCTIRFAGPISGVYQAHRVYRAFH